MENNNTKWYLLGFLGCVWGSSFILMQLGLKGVNSVQMGSLRILFAGLFLILVGYKELAKIPLYKWKFIVLTSLCGTFFPVYLFALALSKIDGSVSSILNSLTPLNTLIVGLLFFGASVQRRQVFGVIIGFVGCLLLVLFGEGSNTTENYYYALLILLASLFYGINVNLIKKYLSDLKPLTISTGNFVVIFIPALVVLYFSDFFVIASQEKVLTSLGYIAVLGVIGTGLSNILFFKLIQLSSPVFAASVTYIIPVVAILLGYFFMNESLNFIQACGAFIVLLGVYLSSRKNS
ncbi:MAG: permease [Flavobacterium sp.]|uniref:DMT family transporter n=1 Tax=unclassified Flavobacterium TaxID=196869 RepID=UPI000C43E260|nr:MULTISPECIES: EamA family transporter [unclassified Flavobacterium]MBF01795.1 permease [Flavobacterium sp.]MCO6161385.1 DMT family transporter [Flavobacterium sp. NRK F7]